MDAEQGNPGPAAEPGRLEGPPEPAAAPGHPWPVTPGPMDGVPSHPAPTRPDPSGGATWAAPPPGGFQPDGFQPDGFQPDGFQHGGFQPGGFQPGGFQPDGPQPGAPQLPPAADGRRRGGFPQLPAVPPRTHRWGLGAYLVVELVFLLASAAVGVLVVGDGPPRAWALAIALAVPTLIAAGLAVLITRLRGNGPREDLRLHWSWREARLGLLFGLGGLFVTLPASVLYMSIVGPDATSAVGEVFGEVRASVPLALVIFACVVFVAPLCEEIVYRGLLWGAVERLRAGRWVAMAVTTLLFALAHFEFTRTPLLLIVAIPIALARLYSGGLLASIVAHQVNNLLPGIALALGLVGVIPMT